MLAAAGAAFAAAAPEGVSDEAAERAARIARGPVCIPRTDYNPLAVALPGWGESAVACFDAKNPPSPEIMEAVEQAVHNAMLRYNPQGSRWNATAGTPVALTWSFIPDGTTIPVGFTGDNGNVAGPSTLFAQMDAKFGGAANRATWIAQFQACFDRWAALTGTSYTRVQFNGNPWDDGAAFGNGGAAGAAGARGDIRIGGRNIDGAGGVLAYNYYPQFGGDQVLDMSENWGNSANSYRTLRNTVLHEHGHGLGLAHVCPSNGSKLMEPFLNTGFDGPQHDDVRGVHSFYGDAYEPNNSAATATVLGTLAPASTSNPSAVPAPAITNGSLTAIDVNGDQDWFRYSLAVNNTVSVTVTPAGANYDASTQASGGACNSGSFVNSLNQAALVVTILGSNGTTVLGTNTAALGSSAVLTNVSVPAGNFYVRVSHVGTPTQAQEYNLSVSAGAIPVPGNDLCANAQSIGFGTVNGANIGALADGGDTCRGNTNIDVWYQIVPPCSGTMILDTCGSTLDTVLSVHTGCPGTTANQVGCNDDNAGAGPCPGGLTSYLTVPVTAGTNYKIRLAGFAASTGNFSLRVGFQGPANDACASAVAVTAGSSVSGQTCGATDDGTGSCGLSDASPDVWYTYTPSCDHLLVLNTCGSNYDTVISVSTGACGSLTEVACNDDAGGNGPCANTLQSYIATPVVAGTTYYIRVAGFAGSVGNFTLNIGPVQQSNDLCANAIAITNGSYTGANCGAAREVNDSCRPTATAGDVWYTWVAPCSGNLVLNTCGSGYDTVISVHTGTCGSLSQVACNDDAPSGPCVNTLNSFISTPVTSGTTYYIRVSGFSGSNGVFRLNVSQQVNDNCADAVAAGLGNTNFDTSCATNDLAETCTFSGTSPDVWYTHTASCSGTVWVDTCGTGFDTVLSVYTGSCGSLTQIACNDDQNGRCASNGLASFLSFNATSGTSYRIRVSGFDNASGPGIMSIRCCAADYNGSGLVSVQDIFDFLADFFANNPRADFNHSGLISVQDIFDFLAAYFTGCP